VPKKLDPKVAEKIMLKAGLKPLEPYKNAITKWKSRCLKCKEIVYPTYNTVQSGKRGCKTCARRLSSQNQRMDEDKAIKQMLKAKLQPLEPYKLSGKPWKCRCLVCGSIVYPTHNAVSSRKSGCNKCGENSSSQKQRKPEKEAINIMLAAKLKPLEPYKKNNLAWKCICIVCGKNTSPSLSSVVSGKGCKWCAGNRVEEKDAIALMVSKGYKPLVPYKSTHTRWKCEHLECGNIVYPQFANIQIGHGGCKRCRAFSINVKSPSYIYLITNYELNAHKIGVGNVKKIRDRKEQFNLKGWETYKVWQFETGFEALDIEGKIFKVIRIELKLPIYLGKEQMGWLRGETETISADSITLLELEKIIKRVVKEQSK